MKRRSFLVAASATTSAVATQPWWSPTATAAPPQSTGPQVAVRTDLAHLAATVDGLTIDGTLDDPRWGEPVASSFTSLHHADPIDDVDLRLVHDDSTFYVGIGIAGAAARTVTYVSVLLRIGRDQCWVTTVEVRPASLPLSFEWGGEVSTIEGHNAATRPGEDRTTGTIAIPFSAIGMTGDPRGHQVGLNVVVDHDDMTAPTAASTPTRSSVNRHRGQSSTSASTSIVDEDRFAPVHLGFLPPLAEGRDAASLARPEELVLDYLDFTTKRIHLRFGGGLAADQVAVDWRPPQGGWTRLETTWQLGRRHTAELAHPGPDRPGQYQLRLSVTSRTGHDRRAIVTFDRDGLIKAGDQLPSNLPLPPRGTAKVTPEPPSAEVEALIALVPDRAGFTFCGVPDAPDLDPRNTFDFSAEEPNQIIARSTGMTYPNERFPEDKSITVANKLGDPVVYPYHEDAEGKRYFLSAHIWFRQREHVYNSLPGLATQDPLGAARVLHRLAQRYPGWVPTNEYPWFNRPVEPASTPRNFYWGGSLTRWSVSDLGAMIELGQAIGTVERTNAFDVLGDELGVDVRARLLDDLIAPAVDFSRSFPYTYGNMDARRNTGLVRLAHALGDSSYIHEVVEWAAEFSRRSFLFDGFWNETTISYHNQSFGGAITVAQEVEGWSDREGYESPRSGTRLTDLDLLQRMPVLESSQRIPKLMAYPDTHVLPIADTWAVERVGAPETGTGSVVLGASGIARLSRGAIASNGPFGDTHRFVDLTVTEQTVDVKYFAGSETMQVEANADGAEVTWEFEVDTTDRYDIDLQPFHAASYGQYEVSIDATVMTVHDFYDTATGTADTITLGQLDLTAGTHTITFIGVGKRSESTNYKMGVNRLSLLDEQARRARDEADPDSANPSQLYLTYTPKYGHNHWDPLSINLWAEGQELLPDIGYTHTLYGRWTMATLGHNTVTVDSADMDRATGVDGGSLEVFDDATPAVQVTRADFGTAYPQTTRYLREVWSIAHPDTSRQEGYALDLFRVAGGSRHELSFNGDANRDAEMATSAPLADYGPYLLPEGVEVTEPTHETDRGDAEGHYYGYIYVRDVKRAELPDGRFDVDLTTSDDGTAGSHVRFHGLAGPSTEMFLGRSPSLRATRLHGTSGDVNTEAVKWTMPKLVLRREGSDLRSSFVTVIEPAAASTPTRIDSVEQLDHDGGPDDIAVKVTHTNGVVDIILSSLSDDGTLTAAGVTLSGKLGWVRLTGDGPVSMHLVGGTALTAEGQTLEGTGAVTGAITSTLRQMAGDTVDALVTNVSVPDWVAGRTVVVTHPDGKTHGYPIKTVTDDSGSTVIELDRIDPGFVVDDDGSSALVFTPFTTWQGDTTFRIENSETG